MKKFIVTLSLVLAIVCFSTFTASADPIYGAISFSGAAHPDKSNLMHASNFTTITAAVENSDGAYAAIPKHTLATFTPFTFNPPAASVTPLWIVTYAGKTYSFDATSMSVPFASVTDLVITGLGIAHITGYDDTVGQWSFTANTAGQTYSFSASSAVNPVPEPATMLLVGVGLTGLAGLRRRFATA